MLRVLRAHCSKTRSDLGRTQFDKEGLRLISVKIQKFPACPHTATLLRGLHATLRCREAESSKQIDLHGLTLPQSKLLVEGVIDHLSTLNVTQGLDIGSLYIITGTSSQFREQWNQC